MTGKENAIFLSGRTAPDSFLKKITFVAWNHNSKILAIENVKAYHVYRKFLVEIEITLECSIPVFEAVSIARSLEKKIEQFEDDVQHCFVSLRTSDKI